MYQINTIPPVLYLHNIHGQFMEYQVIIAFLKVYSEYLNVSVANCECQKNRSFSITKILKGLYFVIGMVMVNDTNRFLTKLEFSII